MSAMAQSDPATTQKPQAAEYTAEEDHASNLHIANRRDIDSHAHLTPPLPEPEGLLTLTPSSSTNCRPPPPTPAERLALYTHYTSTTPRPTAPELQSWFQGTYNKALTTAQAESIINPPRRSHCRSTPKPGLSYDDALERERIVVFAWYVGTAELEGRAPTALRVAEWWKGAEGGRKLTVSTVSGIYRNMRKRGDDNCGWRSDSEDTGGRITKAGVKRKTVDEDEDDYDSMVGPWCGQGTESDEALELARLQESVLCEGEMVPGHYLATWNCPGKRAKTATKAQAPPPPPPAPPKPLEPFDEYHEIGLRLWSWWRKHRDCRRISTMEICFKARYHWHDLGGVGPVPDLEEYVESFKKKHGLVTNEGGPYPADMAYMYQFNGCDGPTRVRFSQRPKAERPWC